MRVQSRAVAYHNGVRKFVFLAACAFLAAQLCTPPARALQPDEILLIINKNSDASRRLAGLYSLVRNIPADRTVALDLPTAEEMPFEVYETDVVAPTRQFLIDHHLRSKIKCLLTFYGVPFRIRNRSDSIAERRELFELQDLQAAVQAHLLKAVDDLEKQAQGVEASFKPQGGDSLVQIQRRIAQAARTVELSIAQMPTSDARDKAYADFLHSMEALEGVATVDEQVGAHQRNDPRKDPAERQHWIALHEQVLKGMAQIDDADSRRWDPDARQKLRLLAAQYLGLLGTQRIVQAQINYFSENQTNSATDNELALLWWNYYSRERMLPNPLNYRYHGSLPPALMVMRLDGPNPQVVERIIRDSVQVEQTGLRGTVAIDARGLAPIDASGKPNGYGIYDEKLRHLAAMLRKSTTLNVVLDNHDAVFAPHSVHNVALYCGWYSLNHYIPGCDFVRGAVGFHIASLEMVTLHGFATGWVHGLLNDGVDATLGAVAEPYLGAFPAPDEFFPLLLTGKLTLAEVYWRTEPTSSWMISCIGDPLYMPYRADPAFSVGDLPDPLKAALEPVGEPATEPTNSSLPSP